MVGWRPVLWGLTAPDAHGYTARPLLGRRQEGDVSPIAPHSSGPRRPTVAIETHGCKLNQADADALAWGFSAAGFRVVAADEAADVYVVNTCTVTHVADRKGRHALKAARRRNPNATIVATGCYAQRAPHDLRALEEVDIIAGNVDKPALVRQIVEWRGGPPVPCAVGAEAEVRSGPRVARTRATVKVQEGCNQICAYCVVPRVRGRESSVPPGDILAQVERYLSLGYKEIVLTGTQLGTYGFDLPGASLAGLIELLLAQTALARLRVSSLQPQEIDGRLLALWSDPRLCPHFHLPLQSGSEAVLKRMRRRYTPGQYADGVGMIRREASDAAVTADVIVGFPGETEEEFEETVGLCEELEFSAIHVFPYSVRPGTSAAHFGGQVDPETKSRRVQRLLRLAERQAHAYMDRSLGGVRPVLWETRKERKEVEGAATPQWMGLTDNYLRVAARSPLPLWNDITLVRLSHRDRDLVYAEIIP